MCATLQPSVDEEDLEVVALEFLIVHHHHGDRFLGFVDPRGFPYFGFPR